jgi:hypothetical protein
MSPRTSTRTNPNKETRNLRKVHGLWARASIFGNPLISAWLKWAPKRRIQDKTEAQNQGAFQPKLSPKYYYPVPIFNDLELFNPIR